MVLGSRAAMGYVLGRSAGAAAAVPWWLSGGVNAANAIAAYQPKSAASLAASYTNLANPGTYDAAPGVAPTFDTATGWTFNGITQYLTTGVTPTGTWSMFVRFSDGTTAPTTIVLIGSGRNPDNNAFMLLNAASTSTAWSYAGTFISASRVTSGVMAMTGAIGYLNGSTVGTVLSSFGTAVDSIYIGARNYGGPSLYSACKIQAVAIYNTTLSAAQVAAISTAMSGL